MEGLVVKTVAKGAGIERYAVLRAQRALAIYANKPSSSEEEQEFEDLVNLNQLIQISLISGRMWRIVFKKKDEQVEWCLKSPTAEEAEQWTCALIHAVRAGTSKEHHRRRNTRGTFSKEKRMSRSASASLSGNCPPTMTESQSRSNTIELPCPNQKEERGKKVRQRASSGTHHRTAPVDLSAILNKHEKMAEYEKSLVGKGRRRSADFEKNFECAITPLRMSLWVLLQMHKHVQEQQFSDLKLKFGDAKVLLSQLSTLSLEQMKLQADELKKLESIKELLNESPENEVPHSSASIIIEDSATPLHNLFFENVRFWLYQAKPSIVEATVKKGFSSHQRAFKGSSLVSWVTNLGIFDDEGEVLKFCSKALDSGVLCSMSGSLGSGFKEKNVYAFVDDMESEESVPTDSSLSEIFASKNFQSFFCSFRNDEHLLLHLLYTFERMDFISFKTPAQILAEWRALSEVDEVTRKNQENEVLSLCLLHLVQEKSSDLRHRLFHTKEYSLALDFYWECLKRDAARKHWCASTCQPSCPTPSKQLCTFIQDNVPPSEPETASSLLAAMVDEFWCDVKPNPLGQPVLRPRLWEALFTILQRQSELIYEYESSVSGGNWSSPEGQKLMEEDLEVLREYHQELWETVHVMCSNPENSLGLGSQEGWVSWVFPLLETSSSKHCNALLVNVLYSKFFRFEDFVLDLQTVLKHPSHNKFSFVESFITTIKQKFAPSLSMAEYLQPLLKMSVVILEKLLDSEENKDTILQTLQEIFSRVERDISFEGSLSSQTAKQCPKIKQMREILNQPPKAQQLIKRLAQDLA